MASYIVFSLLAAIAFALVQIVSKFASKHTIANRWAFLFYYHLSIALFLLAVPLFFEVNIPPTSSWSFIVLYGLTWFIGNIFLVMALYYLDVSTVAPFFQLQVAFIALLAFLFLGERLSALHYLFVMAMVVGAVLVSLDEQIHLKTFFRFAILFVVLHQFFHAFSNVLAGFALESMNSFSFLFWGKLAAFGFSLLLIPCLGKRLKVSFYQVRPLLIIGFLAVLGGAFKFIAFETNVTISSALSLLTSPVVLVLAVLASTFKPDLLEHHTKRVYAFRAVGVGLFVVGALLLSWNG